LTLVVLLTMLGTAVTDGERVRVDPKHNVGKPDSEGGVGFVSLTKTGTPTSVKITYNVKYTISRRWSPRISPRRLHPAVMDTTARMRTGDTSLNPSLLSAQRQVNRNIQFHHQAEPEPATAAATSRGGPKDTHELLAIAREDKDGELRALDYMIKQQKRRCRGWLRKVHCENSGNLSKHLNPDERDLVFRLCNAIKPGCDAYYLSIAHAWDVSKSTVRSVIKVGLTRGASFSRKPRKDIGETLFNSARKQAQVYSAEYVFRKESRLRHAEAPLSTKELKQEWARMTDDERLPYEFNASACRVRGPYLVDEVVTVMKQSAGSLAWRQLAADVAGGSVSIASVNAIRKFVMSLPDSTYTTTRMHPKLDEGCKFRRHQWTKGFWLFWKSATLFTGVSVLLVHMDEKWFYAIVVRRNNKRVPALGVFPIEHAIQHKNHVYKVMFIASTGFVPHNNDIENGGVGYKISFVRVGRMVPAARTTFKRVYKPDGKHHYPRVQANILRTQGELYFQPLEITGSSDGTEKAPKYSLLKFFRDIEIPRLEAVAREIEHATLKKVVIRYQMDGAGPHRDGTLLKWLDAEFDKRGWVLVFQPANSPLTNVKDMSLFPALSKRVTALQGKAKRSLVLEGEELFQLATKAWEELPLSTVARSFAGHHQIVNAIAQCKGGDEFVREKGGIHCGIRQAFVPYYAGPNSTEPAGVELVTTDEDEIDEVLTNSGLKYPTPDVSEHDDLYNQFLSEAELKMLEQHLPSNSHAMECTRQALLINEWSGETEERLVDS